MELSPATLLILQIVAAEARVSPAEYVLQIACARLEEMGIGTALDLMNGSEDAGAE